METSTTLNPQLLAWENLQLVSNKWFHNPDFEALRACLATAKSLDVETRPVWLMLIAPSSCGKSDFYLPCASVYVPHEQSDEVSVGGLLSGSANSKGEGVLKKLTPKGLWVFSDFTVLLNMPEEKRNAVLGAHRRIYDGDYGRSLSEGPAPWHGRVHVIAACTPGIERFHRVNADLGERMLQVRVNKQPPSDGMLEKIIKQNNAHGQFHREIRDAALKLMKPNVPAHIELPISYQRRILDWAEFVATCRTTVGRNYKDEIISVGHEEGTGRVFQEMIGLAMGDAALLGQDAVGDLQMPLIERVAFDCLPWARRAVLRAIPPKDSVSKADLKEMSHITHPYTFDQTIQELQAIGVIFTQNFGAGDSYKLTDKPSGLLSPIDSK